MISDEAAGYSTVITILGLELTAQGARNAAGHLRTEAVDADTDSAREFFDNVADSLDQLADFKGKAEAGKR